MQSTILDVAVFPMHMGMVPRRTARRSTAGSIPHAYGDGSRESHRLDRGQVYSPCIWGWFRAATARCPGVYVFPMHMGMVLAWTVTLLVIVSIPHVYGDGSLFHLVTFFCKEILCPCYLYGFRILSEHEEILQQPPIRKSCIPRFEKPHVQIEH